MNFVDLPFDITHFVISMCDLKEILLLRLVSSQLSILTIKILKAILNTLTRFNTQDLTLKQLIFLYKVESTKSSIFAGGFCSFVISDENTCHTTLSQVYVFGDNRIGQLAN